jgi:hypothetical protein
MSVSLRFRLICVVAIVLIAGLGLEGAIVSFPRVAVIEG